MAQLERELNKEVWQVESAIGADHQWSYKMQFVKNAQVQANGQVNEWHVLESIELTDYKPADVTMLNQDDNDMQSLKAHYSVFIDIVNYEYGSRYDSQAGDVLDKFRLPEGWGCKRSEAYLDSVNELDRFGLDLKANWQLSYEASLELFNQYSVGELDDDPELGPLSLGLEREMLPTTAGDLIKSGQRLTSGKLSVDLLVHNSQIRFQNGATRAKRIVLDRSRQIMYELDKANGFCTMARYEGSDWLLEFPRQSTTKSSSDKTTTNLAINLLSANFDSSLLKLLVADTQLVAGQPSGTGSGGGDSAVQESLFAPLNRYETDGRTMHSSYEHSVESLKLANSLEGPARIVRRFQHVKHEAQLVEPIKWTTAGGRKRLVKLKDFIAVRVFLFSAMDRTKLKAIFDLTLYRAAQEPPLHGLLRAASVYQCYNDGNSDWDKQLQSFTIDYPIRDQFMRTTASFYAPKIGDKLYENLLSSSGLLPLQLDGGVHVELNLQENLLRVHFNVLEAPTSYVYFAKRDQCTMSDELDMRAEVRIVPSLLDCSRWCDHLNCVAMSHCEDRLCKVATERAMRATNNKPPSTSTQAETATKAQSRVQWEEALAESIVRQLAATKQDPSCSYYYNQRPVTRRTLTKFRNFMDHAINSERRASVLKGLSLSFGPYTSIDPVRFAVFGAGKFRWQHEQDNDSANDVGADDGRVEFEDVHGNEAHGSSAGGAQSLGASTFAVLHEDQLIDSAKLDKLRESNANMGITTLGARASSQVECLEACERIGCLLVSHCKKVNQCLLVQLYDKLASSSSSESSSSSVVVDMNQLRSTFVSNEQSKAGACSILMRDQLNKYEQFLDTFVPAKFDRQLNNYSPLECATVCRSAGPKCLSFDLCTFVEDPPASQSSSEQTNSVCLMQTSHISLDSFDRSVMLPDWDSINSSGSSNKFQNRKVRCDHYSKSVLMDFKRIANRKLVGKLGTPIGGIGADRCAIDCLQDDRCKAFEYCRNEKRKPSQACYLIRPDELLDANNSGAAGDRQAEGLGRNETGARDDDETGDKVGAMLLGSKLAPSATCAIYALEEFALKDRLEQTSLLLTSGENNQLAAAESQWSHGFLLALGYMLLAALVGACIQFVYIRAIGRPILFKS